MDIVGKKFGKLTVIQKTQEKAKNNGEYKYKCRCECGKELIVRGSNLKCGNSKSCGCERIITNAPLSKGYRKRNKRLYNIYSCMKQRCYYDKSIEFKNYGGRGIIVCEEWKNDYTKFYNWAINNGYRDNLSIDRIDINGNYEPSNCKWSTFQEQCYNKTTTRYITYNGETHCLAEWAKILKMSQPKLRYRIMNWDLAKAFNK